MDSVKVKQLVTNWARLTNIIEIRNFLGMIGYYRHFMEGFFKITSPLTQLINITSHLINKKEY